MIFMLHMNQFQVYLVTGGWTGSAELVSTEILSSGSDAWRQVGDLPTGPISGLRGVSLNNKIIMTGKCVIYVGIKF